MLHADWQSSVTQYKNFRFIIPYPIIGLYYTLFIIVNQFYKWLVYALLTSQTASDKLTHLYRISHSKFVNNLSQYIKAEWHNCCLNYIVIKLLCFVYLNIESIGFKIEWNL